MRKLKNFLYNSYLFTTSRNATQIAIISCCLDGYDSNNVYSSHYTSCWACTSIANTINKFLYWVMWLIFAWIWSNMNMIYVMNKTTIQRVIPLNNNGTCLQIRITSNIMIANDCVNSIASSYHGLVVLWIIFQHIFKVLTANHYHRIANNSTIGMRF